MIVFLPFGVEAENDGEINRFPGGALKSLKEVTEKEGFISLFWKGIASFALSLPRLGYRLAERSFTRKTITNREEKR